MPRRGYCRICKYWNDYPYKVSERELFNKKVREGTSLRKLELLLEAYGLKARKDLIRTHIKNCMNLEVSEQRRIEKELAKGKGLKSIGKKLGGFFIPKKEEPMIPTECPHSMTVPFFDLGSERVHVRCRQCGKVLSGSADPHKKQKRRCRDLIIYGSLRK